MATYARRGFGERGYMGMPLQEFADAAPHDARGEPSNRAADPP